MRNSYLHFILLLIVVSVSGCRIQQPEFRRVENYRLDRDGLNFSLGTDVVLYNPNRVRFKVQNLAANVTMNNKVVATIGEEVDIKVRGKQEFRVPVKLDFKLSNDIISNLNSILDAIKGKGVRLGFSGNIKFKAYCVLRRELPFDFSKDVNLK